MDIELARTFLAIVASGSFVRAAERLHLSQTTVSARVRLLEQQLRRPLFVRSRAGASLTPAGEQFLRHAPALVQLWERARHQVAVPPGRRAVLAIGVELSLWDPLLLHWLLWMRHAAPDVALRARVGLPEDLMAQVAEGILDIAVVYAPRYRPGPKVEPVMEERLVLVVAQGRGEGGAVPADYVQVDWGPEVGPRQAMGGGTGQPDPALVVSLGPLGLSYILQAGGSGYFRLGTVLPHLRSGRLALVPGAPDFPYPAYAVHAEGGGRDGALLRTALTGLRQAAQATEETGHDSFRPRLMSDRRALPRAGRGPPARSAGWSAMDPCMIQDCMTQGTERA